MEQVVALPAEAVPEFFKAIDYYDYVCRPGVGHDL
jgi:hypothetical protein